MIGFAALSPSCGLMCAVDVRASTQKHNHLHHAMDGHMPEGMGEVHACVVLAETQRLRPRQRHVERAAPVPEVSHARSQTESDQTRHRCRASVHGRRGDTYVHTYIDT